MRDGLFALCTTDQAAGAAVVGLILESQSDAVTNGALSRHEERLRTWRATLGYDADDLRNHIARTANHHRVAHTYILASCLVFIVQRGVRHGDPTDKYGRQLGNGRELARATHLNVYALHGGEGFLRGVLVGNGPTRLSTNKAQLTLQVQGINFVDYPVNIKAKRVASGIHVVMKMHQTIGPRHHAGPRTHGKAPTAQAFQAVVMRPCRRRDIAPLHEREAVSEKPQGTAARDARVQLAHGTCRGIAWVRKKFLTCL